MKADGKYIVTPAFIEYYEEAESRLIENLFKVNHPYWNRAFFLSRPLFDRNTYLEIQDTVAHIRCGFENGIAIGQVTAKYQSTKFPDIWEGFKIDFSFDGEDLKIDVIDSFIPFEDAVWKLVQSSTIFYMNMCFFMDVAEIFEEKISPKGKLKVHNCKYQNKTKQPLTVLNANYLKTSKRTEGFKVRGHFRWQPCGPNRSERKLIFVDSFEKSGYTIQAKKDTILSAHK